MRLPDRPGFLVALSEMIGRDEIVGKLQPLLTIVRESDPRVTVAQGADATNNLREILIELPALLGAGSTEEFLIGYLPLSRGSLPDADAEILLRWQDILGQLYRLGQAPWLDYAQPGDYDDISGFRTQLVKLFQDDLDHLATPRIMVWIRRHQANLRSYKP